MKTVEECIAWVRECIGATPYDDIMVESTTAHLRRLSALEAENKRLRESLEIIQGEVEEAAKASRWNLAKVHIACVIELCRKVRSALSGEGWPTDETIETARRLYRSLEMQAGIMRDPLRTGGWNGAERVASAFERASEKAREIYDALLASPPPVGEMKPTWFCAADDEESGAPDLEALVDATGSNSGETAFQMRVERFARLSDVYVVTYVNDADEWVISEHATEAEADAAFGLVPPPEGEGK